MSKVQIDGINIRFKKVNGEDWISMTDVAKRKNNRPDLVISNWMRQKDTIEFLGLWEQLNNKDFKPIEFEGFRNEAGSNAFTLSTKEWIEKTQAIGIESKSGRYGGTWGHIDIALDFCGWVNSSFRLWVVREFRRLKEEESGKLEWQIKRQIASDNHHMHADSIRRNLVPENQVNKKGEGIFQANEVDMLNDIVFGLTAKKWRALNHDKPVGKNMRDYATKEQLFLLNNLQAMNVAYLEEGIDQMDRYKMLKGICDYQRQLIKRKGLKVLPDNKL